MFFRSLLPSLDRSLTTDSNATPPRPQRGTPAPGGRASALRRATIGAGTHVGAHGGAGTRVGAVAVASTVLLGLTGCGRETPPNLLLVILDTTRADVLSTYGGRAQMPTLDALGQRGLVFEEATAHTPFTLGSVATLLTGLGPDVHGIKGHSGYALDPAATTLAEALGAAGYVSAGFISAVPLRADTGIGQGFDHFDDDLSQPYPVFQPQYQAVEGGLVGVQRRGDETVERAIAWMEGERPRGAPFFLAVHLYDPHEPYDPVPRFLQEYPDDPYAAEVASTDAMIAALLGALERLGVRDETVVCVVADHGEAFMEHDEVGHGTFLYETTLHVPWVLAGPGIPAGRVRGLARLVDLAPTLLAACNVAGPATSDGADLLDDLRRGATGATAPGGTDGATGPANSVRPGSAPSGATGVADGVSTRASTFTLTARPAYLETYYMRLIHRWSEEVGWRDGAWKLVQAPRPELYDLSRDPAELQNLHGAEPGKVEELTRGLRAYLGRPAPGRLQALTDAPDAETSARLASLGYLGTAPTGGDVLRPGWELGLPDPKDAVHDWNRRQQAQAALRIAASAFSLRDYEAALAWADRALALDPQKYEALGFRGRTLAALDRLPEAVAVLRAALAEIPDDADVWVAYGVTQERLGAHDEARRAFRRAVEADPDHGPANLFVGMDLVRAGRMREALPHYGLAALANPKDVPTLLELARVFYQLGEYANARRTLEQLMTVDEQNPDALLILAQTCEKMGDRPSAKAVLEAFIRFHPRHPETARLEKLIATYP